MGSKNVLVCGLLTLFLLSAAIAVVFATLFFVNRKPIHPTPATTTQAPGQGQTSNKPGWKEAARFLRASMDTSVDPCDDFFRFACGGFIDDPQNAVGPGRPIVEPAGKTEKIIMRSIETGVSKPISADTPSTLRKAKYFFNQCLQNDSTPLRDVSLIMQQLGGLPAIQASWHGTSQSAEDLMGSTARDFGIVNYLRLLVYPPVPQEGDPRDTRSWQLYFIPFRVPQNGMGKTVNLNQASYATYITRSLRRVRDLLGMHGSDAQIRADSEAVAQLSFQLMGFGQAQGRFRRLTVSAAQDQWPAFNLSDYLRSYVAHSQNGEVVLQGKVNVVNTAYMDSLNGMIQDHAPSDRLAQNFVLWNFLVSFNLHVLLGDPQLLQIYLDYRAEITLDASVPSMSMLCTNVLLNELPFPASRFYIDEWFGKKPFNTRQKANDMSSNILDAIHGMVGQLDWMTDVSKEGAFLKLEKLVRNIAYPDWLTNDIDLDSRYSSLRITNNTDAFTSALHIRTFHSLGGISLLGTKMGPQDWGLAPAIINAYISGVTNAIFIDAAMLEYPYYDYDYPMATSYGGIGMVIGHEIMHGFDNIGVREDANGYRLPWLDEQSMREFLKMAQCVVDQYNNICYDIHLPSGVKRTCIEGVNTEPDNLADNAGLNAAYRAYMNEMSIRGGEPRLPGQMSSYSMEQVFFLSFAHSWCMNLTPEALYRRLTVHATHSPFSARVRGPLRNMPEFARAFSCPSGSPMAPHDRCSVWVPPRQ